MVPDSRQSTASSQSTAMYVPVVLSDVSAQYRRVNQDQPSPVPVCIYIRLLCTQSLLEHSRVTNTHTHMTPRVTVRIYTSTYVSLHSYRTL